MLKVKTGVLTQSHLHFSGLPSSPRSRSPGHQTGKPPPDRKRRPQDFRFRPGHRFQTPGTEKAAAFCFSGGFCRYSKVALAFCLFISLLSEQTTIFFKDLACLLSVVLTCLFESL